MELGIREFVGREANVRERKGMVLEAAEIDRRTVPWSQEKTILRRRGV